MPIKPADLISVQVEATWVLLLRSLLLVQVALLVATLAVPVLGRDTEPRDDEDPVQTYRLLAGLLRYLSARPSYFGEDEKPFAASLTQVMLTVMVVALVAAMIATLGLASASNGRAMLVFAGITACVLVVAVALLALAQRWLSDDSTDYPLQAGLLIPVSAAIWLASLTAGKARVDDLFRV